MKYLIRQEQLSKLQNLSMPRHLMEELDELKPIEPLSDEAIANAILEPVCCLTEYDREFARAVEKHILGETE